MSGYPAVTAGMASFCLVPHSLEHSLSLYLLQHVPELGWSHSALQQGALDTGHPAVTAGMAARNGPIDLVHFHMRRSNQMLERQLRNMAAKAEGGRRPSTG